MDGDPISPDNESQLHVTDPCLEPGVAEPLVPSAPPWEVEQPSPGDLERQLADLDPRQREAVTHDTGPLLIVAGAGTGKTTVISRRIAHLIAARRAHPAEILALTFTERAAAEMEYRVDLLTPYGFTDMSICTFHAFGDRLIRECALEVGLPDDLRVLSEAERIVFFRERLFRLPLRKLMPLANPTRHLRAILAVIARAKDEGVMPERYLEHARRLREEAPAGDADLVFEADKQLELAQTYRAYQEALEEAGCIDFGDQVLLPLEILRKNAGIAERVRKRFRYILVDEFQDTNVAQYELVKLLLGDERNVTVVGDDDQSIYRFRGASLGNILSFTDDFPARRLVVLDRNYRSGQAILDAAYRLIRYNDPDRLEVSEGIVKRLTASVPEPGRVDFEHYDTQRAEGDAFAARVVTMVRDEGRAFRDIALLVRAAADATPFLQSLQAAGVPYQFSGDQGLYRQPEVQLSLAFLRSIARRHDSQSLYALAASSAYAVPSDDLVRLADGARTARRSLRWMIAQVAEGQALVDPEHDGPLVEALSEAGQAAIGQLHADLARFTEVARNRTTGEVLYQFLSETGVLAALMAEESASAEMRVRNLTRFFERIQRYGDVAMSDRAHVFIDYLELLLEAGDDPRAAEPDADHDAVTVLTVHRAKGLEFPCVFVGNLVMQRFPTARRGRRLDLAPGLAAAAADDAATHLAEERRLFYVAMTRARQELILSSSADQGGAAPRKVSRFVFEALDLAPAAVRTRKRTAGEALEQFAGKVAGEALPAAEDKPIVLRRVAATGIVEFDECPLRFRYAHVLRMPALPHHASSFGTAVHAAVAAYLTARMRGESMALDRVTGVFRDAWRGEGFLSREHEERRFTEGIGLLTRFVASESGASVVPASVEKSFSLSRAGLRVVGRYDRIDLDPHGGGAVIIDYKTADVGDASTAERHARDSLQLKLYALAYAEARGAAPRFVELRYLIGDVRGRAPITDADLARAAGAIDAVADACRAAAFRSRPSAFTCARCPYRPVCPEADRG